jgi:hypothetical protein
MAVKSKVQRLLDATIIREVIYPKWLANTVSVKKKEWQVANVYRFHQPQQGYTKGQLSIATNGSGCGLCGQRRGHVPVGLLLWVSSVLDGEGG